MGTKAGVGISRNRNPREAGREAALQAMRQGGLERCDLLLVFATVGYEQASLVRAAKEASSAKLLTGCSAVGVIGAGQIDQSNHSVTAMAIESDDLRFDAVVAEGLAADAPEVGAQLARGLHPRVGEDSKAVLVFADGMHNNFDGLMKGFAREGLIGETLPFFGGSAADNWAFKRTYQYLDDRVVSDAVVCTLISGSGALAWDVNHGCVPIGAERKVTRAQGNVIYEIDGKPVLDVLKEYLLADEVDNWQKAITNLCVGFRAPRDVAKDYDEYVIRFIPRKDDEEGSVTIQTEVETGQSIWMTRRDQDRMADGIRRMGRNLKAHLAGRQPSFVFHVDCGGRGKLVFREQRSLELLGELQQEVGPDVPWIGFYSFGEIAPVGKRNFFHNYTASVLAVM